jgi:hypothetical protein
MDGPKLEQDLQTLCGRKAAIVVERRLFGLLMRLKLRGDRLHITYFTGWARQALLQNHVRAKLSIIATHQARN